MPVSSSTGQFTRVWKFVDHKQAGNNIRRVDLDTALDDLVIGIRSALVSLLGVVNVVDEWDARDPFPTTRPDGKTIKARDAWVVNHDGSTGGQAWEEGDLLMAVVDNPDSTYAGFWLRIHQTTDLLGFTERAEDAADRAEAAADSAEAFADAMVGAYIFGWTGDGTSASITLPFIPNGMESVLIAVKGGVPQDEDNYSLAGAVFSFDEVVPQGMECEIRVALRADTNAVPTTYPIYPTVAAMAADAAALAAIVATSGTVEVRVKGGYIAGDRGAATLLVKAVSGSETTVSQNSLTVAPGFEIMLGSGVKATWPDRRANAVTMGMRNMTMATQSQSEAANDAFLNKLDDMFDDQFTLWLPAGTYWHKYGNGTITDRAAPVVESEGIGKTIIKQADHLDGGGLPFYGTAGSPNPDIESAPVIEIYGGSYGIIRGIEYQARWMRIRGFWIRGSHHIIEHCKASQTCGRAFAASNVTGSEPDTLDAAFSDMEIRDCVAVQSIGTAFSMYGNTNGRITNCVVETCWAEGATTDASDNAIIRGCVFKDVNRFDDQAGLPTEDVWNGESGNGGIGAIGAASCSNIIIADNQFLGSGQDDPTHTSRTRPFIRFRPNKVDNFGLVVTGNLFDGGFVGVHVEALNNTTDAGYLGLHVSRDFTITGNEFRNILLNSAQGHICIDEGCTRGVIAGNSADNGLKIFSNYNVATTPAVDDTTGHIETTVHILDDKNGWGGFGSNQLSAGLDVFPQRSGLWRFAGATSGTKPPTVSGNGEYLHMQQDNSVAFQMLWSGSTLGDTFWYRRYFSAAWAPWRPAGKMQGSNLAGLPSAVDLGAGAMWFCTNETGGAVPLFSDGTDWRRVTDRAVAS
jgi:hypothetical protein